MKRVGFLCQTRKGRSLIASISVGVKEYEYDFVSQLRQMHGTSLLIIAHGHADSVIRMVSRIKKEELPDTFVIAGNVGTPEAVRELENAELMRIKVGIGPGKVAYRKVKTGFSTGSLAIGCSSLVLKAARKPIIADGGIPDSW